VNGSVDRRFTGGGHILRMPFKFSHSGRSRGPTRRTLFCARASSSRCSLVTVAQAEGVKREKRSRDSRLA